MPTCPAERGSAKLGIVPQSIEPSVLAHPDEGVRAYVKPKTFSIHHSSFRIYLRYL